MDNHTESDYVPTAEEIVAISDFMVAGNIRSYKTQEMKAAGKRVLGYMATIEAGDGNQVPDWVHDAIKTANWAMRN